MNGDPAAYLGAVCVVAAVGRARRALPRPLPHPPPEHHPMSHPIPALPLHQYWVEQSAKAGDPASVARACAAAAAAGMQAIAFHLGPRGLASRWDRLAQLAVDHGLLAVAASGVDGSKDRDGTKLTAVEKGQLLGGVLAKPTCAALLVDAEGQWDVDTGPDDATDPAGAIALGQALRAACPDKPVGDQPWFAIQSHGDSRPGDAANPFRGFPVDEFAGSCVDWIRFRQQYCNNFRGRNRYERTRDWMQRDWAELHAGFLRAGRKDLVRELGVTLQGYGWADILPDLAAALLDHTVGQGQPVPLWGEPLLAPETVAAVRGVGRLVAEGFALPEYTAHAIVLAYQRSFNASAPQDRKLVEDGRCGLATLKSLGITP